MDLSRFSYTIKPEDIYPPAVIEAGIPDGYEVVTFDYPSIDEFFLTLSGELSCPGGVLNQKRPRLILRKKEPRRVTFVECSAEESVAWFGGPYPLAFKSHGIVQAVSADHQLQPYEFFCKLEEPCK